MHDGHGVHHLVGHINKVAAVASLGNGLVVSGSEDGDVKARFGHRPQRRTARLNAKEPAFAALQGLRRVARSRALCSPLNPDASAFFPIRCGTSSLGKTRSPSRRTATS